MAPVFDTLLTVVQHKRASKAKNQQFWELVIAIVEAMVDGKGKSQLPEAKPSATITLSDEELSHLALTTACLKALKELLKH